MLSSPRRSNGTLASRRLIHYLSDSLVVFVSYGPRFWCQVFSPRVWLEYRRNFDPAPPETGVFALVKSKFDFANVAQSDLENEFWIKIVCQIQWWLTFGNGANIRHGRGDSIAFYA